MGGEMKRMTRRAFVAGAAAGAMAAGSRALALTPTARPLSSETLAAAEEAVEAAKDRLALPAILSSLTLEQKVGQLFVTRPEAVVGYGTCLEVTDEYRVPYMERPIGGVMLKDANFIDPDQTRRLNEGL